EGTAHTLKGTKLGICRSLKEGLLGDASNIRASRTKEGPFEALRSFPEFRQLVVEPAPLSASPPRGTPRASATLPAKKAVARTSDEPAGSKNSASSKSKRTPHIVIATKKTKKPWLSGMQMLLLLGIMIVSLIIGLFFFLRG